MDINQTLQDLLKAVLAHQWIGAAILIIGALMSALQPGSTLIPWNIPDKYRTWAVFAFGAILGVLKGVVSGASVLDSVLQGLVAAVTELVAYHAVVKPFASSGELFHFKKPGDGSAAAFFVVAVTLASSASGCAQLHDLQPALADAAVVAGNASEILSLIEAASSAFFLAHPDPKIQGAVQKGLTECHLALATAQSTVHGAQDLDKQDVDAAFKNFRDAYASLYQALVSAGIYSPDGHMKAERTAYAYTIPKPIAVTMPRIREHSTAPAEPAGDL